MADPATLPGTLEELRRGFAARGSEAAILAFAGDRQETLSFSELGTISARLGAGLAQRDIARGDGVALIAPNSPRWIVAFWSIVAAGAVAVPLDAQNDDRDLARMIETGKCRLVFTMAASAERLRKIAPACVPIILDRENDTDAGASWQSCLAVAETLLPAPTASDPAVIVFTSGTTGTPKAVPLAHANLLINVRALTATHLVGQGDRALLPLPLYHAYPLTIGMITPLALGCGVVLPAGVSGPELIAAIRDGGVTALVGVPRLYTALLDNVRRGIAAQPKALASLWRRLLALSIKAQRHGTRWPGKLLLAPVRRGVAPHLRLLVSGGAAINAEIEETLDALGWEMLTGYGLVETASMLTFNPPGAAVPGSAGKPVPGMTIRIAAPDADGVGEIETRGPSLFSGYRDDPAKTASAFTPDGWFRTGDLGSIDAEGYLHIAARKTETIVLADGKKLFPEEFEGVYAAAPLVREAALLGIDGTLVGLVVPDLAAARDLGALRLGEALREGLAAAATRLPSYARLSGFAVAAAPLPRTQLGKIRRHLLPALYQAAQRHEAAPGTAELSEDDRKLLDNPIAAAVWRWLAKRFADRSLALDTILQLDLGVDSLGWVELTLALERDLGITLKEQEIARIVTLRDLLREAATARRAAKSETPRAEEMPWLKPLGSLLGALRAMTEPLLCWVVRRSFHLHVEGIEKLPRQDPILICPNHVSYLDPFVLGAALPRDRLARTYWGGWTGVAFQTRLRRLFSRLAHVIPIDPDRAAASGLTMGGAVLERGWNLVWFPEGGRSRDGRLQRFLPSNGALMERRAVAIVPVYIEGSFAAWPVERRFPRRGAITVRFGEPILPASLPTEGDRRSREEQIAATVQAAVAALIR